MQHFSIPVPFTDPSRTPEGVSIVAVGDVHGHLALLEPVLERLEARAAAMPERRHVFISLGDIIDRGPDSAGVVARLMRGVAGCETVLLRGNHETLMLDFHAGSHEADPWLQWGGLQTLASYGVDITATAGAPDPFVLRRAFREVMDPEHLAFLKSRPLSATYGDYFFVHAGARPGIPLSRQEPNDLIWIRDEMHSSPYRFEKRIVHGHTPVDVARIGPTQINLDTGACYGGTLTAMLFEDETITPF